MASVPVNLDDDDDSSSSEISGKNVEIGVAPNRGGRVKAPPKGPPPIPLPPGKNGETNEWVQVPGTQDGQYGPRWQPKVPVEGPQPSAWWDPKDGYWSGEKGDGSNRDHYDPWGNKVNMTNSSGNARLAIFGGAAIITGAILLAPETGGISLLAIAF